MKITRRHFLAGTTALTATGLFGIASAPIDPENLQRDRWYSVWFQPTDRPPIRMAKLSGVSRYPVPEGSFLTLDPQTMQRLKIARPGVGLRAMQTQTTHIGWDPSQGQPG